MESRSSNLESTLEAAVPRSAGVAGNPYLAGGFLIGSSLLGLLIIIGAFWYHRNNLSLFKRSCIMFFSCQQNSLMSVQLIHNSLMSLLIVDAVNLLTIIIFSAEMVGRLCYGRRSCLYIERAWFLSRWFGVIIHLLNASLSISHLCHQSLSVARVRIISVLIGVMMGITIPLYVFVPGVAIFILATFMFLFALAVIVTFAAFTSSPSTAILKKRIMVVAMYNFLLVYVPTFIIQCLLYSSYSSDNLVNYIIAYVNVQVFTNLHLIFDGLQCALVLKLPSGEEQQQQQQQELQQWQQQQQQQQSQQHQFNFLNPGYTVSANVYQ